MFDREGFIEYVGEKSGNSYASGLGRIEKLFSVGIDAPHLFLGSVLSAVFLI